MWNSQETGGIICQKTGNMKWLNAFYCFLWNCAQFLPLNVGRWNFQEFSLLYWKDTRLFFTYNICVYVKILIFPPSLLTFRWQIINYLFLSWNVKLEKIAWFALWKQVSRWASVCPCSLENEKAWSSWWPWGHVVWLCGSHQASGRLTLQWFMSRKMTEISRHKLWRGSVLQVGMKRNIYMLLGNGISFVSLLGKSKLWLHIDRISWGKEFWT